MSNIYQCWPLAHPLINLHKYHPSQTIPHPQNKPIGINHQDYKSMICTQGSWIVPQWAINALAIFIIVGLANPLLPILNEAIT